MLLEEDIGTNLDKIPIELTRLHNNYVIIHSIEAFFEDDSNFETDVYYSSYSMYRLSNYRFRCNEMNTEFSILQTDRLKHRFPDFFLRDPLVVKKKFRGPKI
jgi:hypothetical protein